MLNTCLTHISSQTPVMSFTGFPRWRQQPPVVRSCHRSLDRTGVALRRAPTIAVDNKTGVNKGMNWFYEMEEEVREYELDGFGVVNNAVYSNYCEYATYKLLDEIGFDADIKLAVTQISVNYIAPLKRKDRYLLKLRIYDYSITRLFFENQILKLPNHEVILKGASTLVLLDERLRPSRITSSIISKFNQYLSTHDPTI